MKYILKHKATTELKQLLSVYYKYNNKGKGFKFVSKTRLIIKILLILKTIIFISNK